MSSDDKAARKARAEEIRAKARRIRPPPETPAASEPRPTEEEAESPRDFIERRMREIDREKKPRR